MECSIPPSATIKMDIRQKYEKEKLKVTKEVSKIMEVSIKRIFKELDKESIKFIKILYEGRKNRAIKGGRLRDMIVYLSLKSNGVKRLNKNHLKVIASGEFYNMASYYQNWHLDDKKEIKTENDKKLCHIASHLFREIAEELILETDFDSKIKLKLLKELNESNTAIQLGQEFGLNNLNLNNPELDLSDEEKMYEFCEKRCFLASGRFYGYSFAMGAIMANAKEEIIDKFREIGNLFGTGGQIINDVGDFCLSKNIAKNPEKDYQDQFADLEKGMITLPIYELLKNMKIKKFINRKIKSSEKKSLLKTMVKDRCFDSSRKKTNEVRNKIIKELSTLKPNKNIKELKFIVKTFFNSNKYYVNLREEHRYKW